MTSKHSVNDAQILAKELFQIQASAHTLHGECDSNFHLGTEDGKEYLLKISTPDSDLSVLDLQNSVLKVLEKVPKSFSVPSLLASGKTSAQEEVRLFPYLQGTLLGKRKYHSPNLLKAIGEGLGELNSVLANVQHPAAKRDLKWDIMQASWLQDHTHSIADTSDRKLVQTILDDYENRLLPILKTLRRSVIHGDMNDYNILVKGDELRMEELAAFIDFGDLHESVTIAELAICATYLMMHKKDPIEAACHLIEGYHRKFPLSETEIEVLLPLIKVRLCTSVVNSACQKVLKPNDPYVVISEKPAWELLRTLNAIHPRFALYMFRNACGWEPCPRSLVLPRADAPDGGYNEARSIYTSENYLVPTNDGYENRSIHLGYDLVCAANTPIHAPLDGRVHSFRNNDREQDYGPTIILEHNVQGEAFYSLYGHLSLESLHALHVGKEFKEGEVLCYVGDENVNGGWPPHLHFQLIRDLLSYEGNFPGVARPSQRDVWTSICPNPGFLVNKLSAVAFLAKSDRERKASSHTDILTTRKKYLGKSLSLSYREPIHMVRGIGQYLYNVNGRQYLDAVNNVCHVGHCHPRVVEAGQKQMAKLNTNTRYLYDELSEYAERLTATFPEALKVCFFVCSGSEANELALRMAFAHTQRKDVIVVDAAYHGNTSTLVNISPYKFNGKGGKGKPEFVHVMDLPDPLRGKDCKYANQIDEILNITKEPAAFICESLLSCGGQLELPEGYLKKIYSEVRKAGGVCIADEVQVGLGRIGTHFWAFESQGVVPDIVTIGKPLGNGHPMAAVVTTQEIADSFANGMEYFNTFGGNPVSCAIGLSVLDVIQEEKLQAHALNVGNYLRNRLENCKLKFPIIGDVRGRGLFLGVEFVRENLKPAADYATYIVERMKERGILLSTDGPYHNVIKFKPPMVFSRKNADFLVEQLQDVLEELRV